MQANQIKEHIHKRPFVPFRIRLSDGSTFDVTSAEMALVSRDVVYAGHETRPGSGVAEEIIILNLPEIRSIEVLDQSQTAK